MTQIDSRKKNGFVLLVVAGLLVILGVILLKTFPVGSDVTLKNVEKTEDKLKVIKRALLVYYEANGVLPCPALNTLASNVLAYGVADCAIAGTVKQGGVPFKTIGLSAHYMYDDWKHRFTYVMDTSYTGYMEGGDTIQIKDSAGADIVGPNGGVIPQFMGLIISHGADGVGAYNQGRAAAATIGKTCGAFANTQDENCDGDLVFLKSAWSATNDDLVETLTPCPGAVNGCVLWLDASATTTLTTPSAGAVSAWADKSGKGNQVMQSLGNGVRPSSSASINSLNALLFDGNDYMSSGSNAFFRTNEHSIFVVAESTANAQDDLFGTGGVSTGSGDVLLMNYLNKFRGHAFTSSSSNTIDSVVDSFTYPTLYNQNVDNSTINIFRNAAQDSSLATSGTKNNSTQDVFIGARNAGSSTIMFNGKIGEVLVYDSALSVANRQKIECSMARKWGVFPKDGLQLWLDANDVDGDNNPANNNDGDDVTTWVDKSGGVSYSATGGNPPKYQTVVLNGKPVIRFDGIGNYLVTPAIPNTIGSDAFVVFSRSNANQEVALIGVAKLFMEDAYTSYGINGAAAVAVAPISTLASIIYAKTNTNSNNIWNIGQGGNALNGDIAEIIVYNRTLSDEERRITECYLSGKWDITITQP